MNELDEVTKEGQGWHGILYGQCPIQGDGEVDGEKWYFKARGERWHFEIIGKPEYNIHEKFTNFPEAGFISYDKSWEFVEEGIKRFRLANQ